MSGLLNIYHAKLNMLKVYQAAKKEHIVRIKNGKYMQQILKQYWCA